ncbi:hypothetical protein KP79_PYT15032 [Mizuhopecten yessoensis]|uniref:Secreted protein n=1 Tax=Mizuhopecten yessoensis TaxID=6573 RepID=A0A210QVR7_MIZYE|nr:hypothetical protein KP79_PYT15032 [Mizuhopecten yessoensis]
MVSHALWFLVALWVCVATATHCLDPISCLSGRYPGFKTVTDCIFGVDGLEQRSYHSNVMSCEGNGCMSLDPLTHQQAVNAKQTPRNKLHRKLKVSKCRKRKRKRISRRKRRNKCT